MNNDLLTTAQVAAQLDQAVSTVWRLVRNGKLPAARVGKRYMIRADDVALMLVPIKRREKTMDDEQLIAALRKARATIQALTEQGLSELIAVQRAAVVRVVELWLDPGIDARLAVSRAAQVASAQASALDVDPVCGF